MIVFPFWGRNKAQVYDPAPQANAWVLVELRFQALACVYNQQPKG
jgi:hypothetical protein